MASPEFQHRFRGRTAYLSKAGIDNTVDPLIRDRSSLSPYNPKTKLKPIKPLDDSCSIFSSDTRVSSCSTRARIKSLSNAAARNLKTPEAKLNKSVDLKPRGLTA